MPTRHERFGPWATLIAAGRNPQLSAFWRRRLTRLPHLAESQPRVTRSAAGILLLAASALAATPTLQDRASSEEPAGAIVRESSASSAGVRGTAPANGETALRYVKAALRVREAALEAAREANRKVPGSVSNSELRLLELAYKLAQVEVEEETAILQGSADALPALHLRCATLALRYAEAELDNARAANRLSPGAVPAAEMQQREWARELAAVEVQWLETPAGDQPARKELRRRWEELKAKSPKPTRPASDHQDRRTIDKLGIIWEDGRPIGVWGIDDDGY